MENGFHDDASFARSISPKAGTWEAEASRFRVGQLNRLTIRPRFADHHDIGPTGNPVAWRRLQPIYSAHRLKAGRDKGRGKCNWGHEFDCTELST